MTNTKQDKIVDTKRPNCGCGSPSDGIGNVGEILCASCWLKRYRKLDKIKLDSTRSLLYEKLQDNVGVSIHEKGRY